MTHTIRNRIKAHRRVRAGDLVPHEFNFRTHPELQRAAVAALYREVGFARSLLAYELPDGRLKLIDGHLRRDLDPDMEVEVEVLDINEEEARTLLLSIDPLAALAETQEQIHDRLVDLTPNSDATLAAVWRSEAEAALARVTAGEDSRNQLGEAQFMVLITCRDEAQQVELLQRFGEEGIECKALLS
jgi:hypothetical protein